MSLVRYTPKALAQHEEWHKAGIKTPKLDRIKKEQDKLRQERESFRPMKENAVKKALDKYRVEFEEKFGKNYNKK